jgi:hypothetical protein
MKLDDRSWPHPVLTSFRDDIADSSFEFNKQDSTIQPAHSSWRIVIKGILDDEYIKNLIEQGIAEYVLHVECDKTYYRKIFKSNIKNLAEWDITIPSNEVSYLIECTPLVIAKKTIEEYRHPKQNSDYDNETFCVTESEPLAYSETLILEAGEEPPPLDKLSSIIQISKANDGAEFMEINCAGEKILVQLPEEIYVNYCKLRTFSQYSWILSNSVILPALHYSLSYFVSLNDEQKNEFMDRASWLRSIAHNIKKTSAKEFNILEEKNLEKIFQLVQILLRNPVKKNLEDALSDPSK